MSGGTVAGFPPSMDIATALAVALSPSVLPEGMDCRIACKQVLDPLLDEGLGSVADLRLAFHCDPMRRDSEVRALLGKADVGAVNAFIGFLVKLYEVDFFCYTAPIANHAKRVVVKRVLFGNMVPEGVAKVSKTSVSSSVSAASASPSTALSLRANSAMMAAARLSVSSSSGTVCDESEKVVMADAYSKDMVKAVDMGVSVLMFLGKVSIRFVELYGPDGSLEPSATDLASFRFLVQGKLQSDCLVDYCRETRRFATWAFALGFYFNRLGSLCLVGYLRNVRSRGKTVPTRVRCALVWAEEVFRIKLDAGRKDIVSICVRLSRMDVRGRAVPDPVQATLVPPIVVSQLEELVTSAPTLPLRIFCGVAALCAHGIKRWGDVQHTNHWKLTEHAIVARTWRSKKRQGSFTWAALRTGFSDCDWVGPWFEALNEAGLPGEDFLVLRPTADFKGFTRKPAKWSDACKAVQTALVLTGCRPDEAVSFSMHSFRHVLPTMARQLLVPDSMIATMGGWRSGDPMPGLYDSIAASSELAYKEFVRANFVAGWKLQDVGMLPMPAVVPLGVPGASLRVPDLPAPPLPELPPPVRVVVPPPVVVDMPTFESVRPDGTPFARGGAEHLLCAATYVFPDSVVQVMNTRTNTVHLHLGSSLTVCGSWKLGSRAEPISTADFALDCNRWSSSSPSANFCSQCFSDKGMVNCGALLNPTSAAACSASEAALSTSSVDDSSSSDG